MARDIATALDAARLASQRAEETPSSVALALEAADCWSELGKIAGGLANVWLEKALNREKRS